MLAEVVGLGVYYYDIQEKLALGNAKKCRTLGELLAIADVISVHIDGQPGNEKLIGNREFQAMKDGVVFLNAGRSSIVDMKALAHCNKRWKGQRNRN